MRIGSRVGLALLASAALHALVLALVRDAPRPAPEPIELEVVWVEPEAAERAPSPGASATDPAGAPATPPVRARAAATRAPKPASAPAGPSAAETGPAPAPGVPDPSTPRGVGEARAIVLFPAPAASHEVNASDAGDPPENTPGDTLSGLDAALVHDAARRRAAHRDAAWRELELALDGGFRVDEDTLEDVPGVEPGGFVGRWMRSWTDGAARYGSTGSPVRDGALAPGARGGVGRETAALLSRMPELAVDAGAWEHQVAALVLVVQGEDGAVERVELWRSSGSPALDRVALAEAQGLVPPGEPPAQGQGSLWSFEAERRVTPPLPVAGCSLDADFSIGECTWPLKVHVRSRVRLVAVYRSDELLRLPRDPAQRGG